jgi:hypothetical protein
VRHLGILAHSTEGAALCFLAFCQEGFRELGVHQHPDVTMDCIAMGRSMPAWEAGEHRRSVPRWPRARSGWPGRAPTSSSVPTTPPTWR